MRYDRSATVRELRSVILWLAVLCLVLMATCLMLAFRLRAGDKPQITLPDSAPGMATMAADAGLRRDELPTDGWDSPALRPLNDSVPGDGASAPRREPAVTAAGGFADQSQMDEGSPAERSSVGAVDKSAQKRAEDGDRGYFRDDIPLGVTEQRALYDAAGEFGVPHTLALAVIERETQYSNILGDNGDSYGYMQIQPRWWSGLMADIGAEDLLDPEDNFRTGCAILAQLLAAHDSTADALTAYNSGQGGESAYASAVLEIAERLGQ